MSDSVIKPIRMQPKNLFKGQILSAAFGSLVLKISSVGLGLVTNIILARSLGTGEYGLYAYALAWVNLLYVPAMLGFDKLLVRETSISQSKQRWSSLRGLRRWSALTAFGLSSLLSITIILFSYLSDNHLDNNKINTLLFALPLLPILALGMLCQSTMQGLRRVVIGQIPDSLLRPLLFIIALAVFVIIYKGQLTASKAIVFNTVTALIALGCAFILVSRFLPPEAKVSAPEYQIKGWMKSAAPLMILGVIQTTNAQIAVLILGFFRGAEEVGLFSVAVRTSAVGSFFLLAFNSALAPHFARLYANGEKKQLQEIVTKSSWLLLLLCLPVCLIFWGFGKPILSIFGSDFAAANPLLAILVIGILFNSVMGSVGLLLTMTGHELQAVAGISISLAINFILCGILVPTLGALGAAIATTVYLFVWNIIFAGFVFKKTGIVPSIMGKWLSVKL